MKKYQPSNGTEGMYFMDEFCMKCVHCDPNPEGAKQCDILCRSMAYDVSDDEYPIEWTYDHNGNPTCTAHLKWDWSNDGDPDDPDNPNQPPIQVGPNQISMFDALYSNQKPYIKTDFNTKQTSWII